MRIVAIHEKTVSLASSARNASTSFRAMTASAVVVVTDVIRRGKPVCGLAFDSAGRYAHGGLLRERFIPRLLAADPDDYADERDGGFDPFKIWAILMQDEKPGGHGERPGAVGLIDAAVWDVVAKLRDQPLWHHLAERTGASVADPRVPVYATGGYYREDNDLQVLRDELRQYLGLGYTRVKIKIGGAPLWKDLERIETALEVLGKGAALAVDCNGTLSKDAAFELVDSLAQYHLAWIEEPVDPLDFELHRELAAHSRTPLATGENIFSAADTRNLLRYGGLRPQRDFLQMDISLSYGIVEYLRMLRLIEGHGWSRGHCMPHGGHVLSLNAVAGLGLGSHETAPLGRFALGLVVEDGLTTPGSAPGVGIEARDKLYQLFQDIA
jgi:L-alanine-DL-glutamate epimerase-like enolase superfamily enzyme